MQRRTKVLSVSGGVIAALLLAASAAFACVNLATLDLSPGKGAAGTTVKGDVTNFINTAGYSDISVRWGGTDGPVLATVPKPTTGNATSFSFTVPADAKPGTYAVVATQTDPQGVPVWGAPARATFTVPGVAAGVAPATEAAPAPETVTVEQKYVVNGEATPAPAAAPAAPAPAVRPAPAKVVPAPAAPAAAAAAPTQPSEVLSLEAQDAITEKVAPVGARNVNYVPATSRAASSSNNALHLGIALAALGSMALLTAAAAAYILRPTPVRVKR